MQLFLPLTWLQRAPQGEMEAIERDRKQEEQEQKLLETLGLTFWTKPDSTNNNKTAAKRNRIQKANGGRMKMSIDDENCNCCEELLSNYYMAFCDRNSRSSKSREEDAKNWAKGMGHLLQSAYGIALFRAFLQKEYAEENLDFVLKVTAYKECSPRKRQKMAWKLYKTYIAIGAPHELNLDILSRRVTDLAMITPHVSTFDSAQKRVFNLLENDAYRRFLQWDIYRELAAPSSSSSTSSTPPMEMGREGEVSLPVVQQQHAETRL